MLIVIWFIAAVVIFTVGIIIGAALSAAAESDSHKACHAEQRQLQRELEAETQRNVFLAAQADLYKQQIDRQQ